MYKFDRRFRYPKGYLARTTLALFFVAIGVAIFLVIHKSPKDKILGNNNPLTVQISDKIQQTLFVNEPYFSMRLPGPWKEIGRNVDGNYQSIQWQYTDKKSAGRWLRVYIDTIPKNFGVNYVVPIVVNGAKLQPQAQTNNCVTFTKGANQDTSHDISTPIKDEVLPSSWQGADFMCANSRVSHQVVGTSSSSAGVNTVAVEGKSQSLHRYFFVYNDDNYHPNYYLFTSALSSFQAK